MTVLLAALAVAGVVVGWLLLALLVAVVVGRVIALADRRARPTEPVPVPEAAEVERVAA